MTDYLFHGKDVRDNANLPEDFWQVLQVYHLYHAITYNCNQHSFNQG